MVYEHVSKKRVLCEEICRDCKSVLKPWPKRVNQIQGKACSAKQHSEDDLTAKQAEVVSLSNTDLEDLKLVNKVLAKAEKVRQSNVAIIPPPASLAVCEKTTADLQFAEPEATNLVVHKSSKTSVPANNQTNGKLVAASRSTSSVIKQSELTGILEHQSNKALPNKKSKVVSHSGKQYAPPLSKPAHQIAPFKTDIIPARRLITASDTKLSLARSRSSSQQLRFPSSTSRSASDTKLTVAGSRSSSQRLSFPSSTSKSASETKLALAGSRSSRSSSQQLSSSSSTSQLSASAETVTLASGKDLAVYCAPSNSGLLLADESGFELQHQNDEQLQSSLSNLRLSSDIEAQPRASPLDCGEEQFTLEKHGADLKLSKEFSNLVSTNRKLREGLSAWCCADSDKLRSSEICAENFRSKLNADILSQQSKISEQLVVLNSFRRLYDWLRSLLDSVENINILELSEWQRVMRSKVTLEFVLQEFVNMENDFRMLIQTEAELAKDVPIADRRKSFDSRRHMPLQWLTNDLRIGRGFPPLPRRIRYRNHSQLAQYTSLLHHIQLQLLHRNILIEAGDDVIRLLEQSDSNDRSFKRLYQAAFSLLASNGQHFPVIIRDSF